MKLKLLSFSVIIGCALILASAVPAIDATHNPSNDKDARKQAEAKSKEIEEKKIENGSKIRLAFKNYKTAFSTWKTTKEIWKSAKSSGDQEQILQTKILLDAAENDKLLAWAEFLDVLKSK